MNATPRPWKVDQVEGAFRLYSEQDPAGMIARLTYGSDYNEQSANAELIVRAVNSYDAMREALEALIAFCDPDSRLDQENDMVLEIDAAQALQQAKAALALAKGA